VEAFYCLIHFYKRGAMSNVCILGYWDIRGLAEPIRLLLEHVEANYEDRRMNMSKPSWLEYKGGLGFDFPNLPYYQVMCHLWVKNINRLYIYNNNNNNNNK